ncbi:aspartate aminotransferase [Methanohalophilus levihalophilus]|uniref:pyridoxal phosphate-dependent aminotransferase n=1 Tax=Methanohalophilus levihalophilus TaxID=1431282 RepID=UPI001AE81D74|nr:pyridoxal phosphate-dependent aminotransferase [Methanohalophilus levihalophilus]MBP2029667.1 aspartate aminotransferase [Methanohalophilus levihalophilus]
MIPERVRNIPPFYVMEVLEEAQQLEKHGASVIHLEIGEPDFPTAPHICEAAHQALSGCITRYTHSMGIPELRKSIANYYNRHFDVDVSPEQVIVTSGTSPALMLAFMLLVEQGHNVLMSNPHYACYPNFVTAIGGTTEYVPVNAENGFSLNAENIQMNLNDKTDAILLNTPSNPAGSVMDKKDLKSIAEIEGDIPIVCDEIYQGLTYGKEDHTILEYTDNAIALNGFSKKYCMTGWRLGYMIAPKSYLRVLQKMQQNFFICANSFVQEAGIAALEGPQDHVEKMVETYDMRRKYMLKRLKEIGLGIEYEPDGAFYILANAREYGRNSLELSRDILEKTHVAVTPGIDFGKGAEGYIRFSYANSLENIEEGMNRLEKYLNG